MHKEKTNYLIFDFDGVIGDTKEAAAKSTSKVEGVDFETALTSNQKYAHNKPNHTRDHTLSDEDMKRVYDWTVSFGEYMRDSHFPLFSDFVEEIEALDTKYKAVVSSGSQLYVIPALAKTAIHPTHILAFENHHSKEEKIEIICKDWGIEVSEVYYITDTLADIYELQNFLSKDKLIAVSWGFCTKEAIMKELDEKFILNSPKDIHSILANR